MARTTTITTTAVRVRLSQCVKSADPRVREPDGEAFVQSDATIPDDSVETAEWYRERAESGKSFAMNNLAYLYEHGLGGVEKDDAQALSWYWRAVEAGEPAAMNNLAYAYANGLINLTKDDIQAAGLYRKSAHAGNAPSMYNLAYFYENGLGGLPKDQVRALKWYVRAADAGEPAVNGLAAEGLNRLVRSHRYP